MIFPNRLHLLVSVSSPWFERALWLLICWQVAGLVWQLFAPTTMGPMPVPPRQAPARAESSDALLAWFDDETKAEASAASDYTLLAVIAGRNGVAVLKSNDGKSLAVRSGDSFDSDNRLLAVEPDSVTIERGNIRQEIKLPWTEPRPLLPSSQASGPTKTPVAKTATQNTIRITRGQMLAVMRSGNVAGWDKGLSNAPDGGIRVDRVAAQPFALLLHLKDGDILKKVNQRPLERIADVSLVFFHFGQSTAVDLEFIRRGVATSQRYDIQP